MADVRVLPATGRQPGAIGILQLVGNVEPMLSALTGIDAWPVGRAKLTRLDGIDEGLAVRLAEDLAQVMPHGGPRVVQRLMAWLAEHGAVIVSEASAMPAEVVYPEAGDRFEALALAAVTRAASPLAVDLLLAQPLRWRDRPTLTEADRARARRLNRLIDPPVVVLAGPANVGKSTLSNVLLGRSMSIAADAAGTTRDFTSGRLELAGLVVDLHDTPGLRDGADDIERRAVELARRLLHRAEFVIAMTDATHDWPLLEREPDLRVASKSDLGSRDDADVAVSALAGTGIAELVSSVRDRLVAPADLADPGPWLFDDRLLDP